jgi:hypothetical protein
MKKSVLLIWFILILSGIDLRAFDIMIAPLTVTSPDTISLTGRQFSTRISDSNLYLRSPSLKSGFVSNLLEAAQFCENEVVDNLIYGSVKAEGLEISIELRLYNHESRTIEMVFYASDHINETDRLIENMGYKLHSYFIHELGLYEEKDKPLKPDFITFPLAVGYWVPFTSEWGDLSESLFNISAGIRLNPNYNLIDQYHMNLTFHFGFSLTYEMGINDPAYETFYLHKLIVLFPLELCLSILTEHDISFYLSPLYQLDIMDKYPRYDDGEVEISSGFGFSTGLGYHYNFSENFSAGLTNHFDFIFYETPQIVYRPEFSFLFHSGLFKKEKNP